MGNKKRLKYIDMGKAVAMLFVVFGHINLFCIYGQNLLDKCKVSHYTSILQLTLFMFLSGLVLSSKYIRLSDFVQEL